MTTTSGPDVLHHLLDVHTLSQELDDYNIIGGLGVIADRRRTCTPLVRSWMTTTRAIRRGHRQEDCVHTLSQELDDYNFITSYFDEDR